MKNHHHNHPIHLHRSEGAPTHEAIASRARTLWIERGCPELRDEAIWLEAESALLAEQSRTKGNPGLGVAS